MTVSTTSSSHSYNYTGPGDYDYDFKAFADDDIVVKHIYAGVETVLVEGTNYSVSRNSNEIGGRVTTTYDPASYGELTISRSLKPYLQETDWINNDALDMEILEKSFDEVIMMIQEVDNILSSQNIAYNWQGDWVTATGYSVNDIVRDPTTQNILICANDHTSGTLSTDITNGEWAIFIDIESSIDALDGADWPNVLWTSLTTDDMAVYDGAKWINRPKASTAEMQAGTETAIRSVSPSLVKDAIDALAAGGGSAYLGATELRVTRTNATTVRVRARSAVFRNATGLTVLKTNIDVNVDITASGAGGLDQGAEATSKFYQIHLIYDSTGDTVSGIFKLLEQITGTTTTTTSGKLVDSGGGLSAAAIGNPATCVVDNTYATVTAVDSDTQLSVSDNIFPTGKTYAINVRKPVLPGTYDYWTEPLSYVWNNSSGNIEDFVQNGKEVHYKARQLIASGINQTSYTTQEIFYAPTRAHVVQSVLFGAISTGAIVNVHLSDDGTNGKSIFEASNTNNGVGGVNELYNSDSAAPVFIPVNRDDVYYKINAQTISFYCRGYRLI